MKTQNLSVLQRAERKRSNLLLIETVVTLASRTSLVSLCHSLDNF